MANNMLTELPFNPLLTAPGLRRLTLSGNKLSEDTMKLAKDAEKGSGGLGALDEGDGEEDF